MPLPDFSAARVVVAGDVMLDRYWRGPSRRVSPEAPVPIVQITAAEDRPGGAGNVAVNVAALGARVGLFALSGDDADGAALRAALAARGLDDDATTLLTPAGARTIVKLRVLSQNQQLLRLDFEQGFAAFDPAPLNAAVAAALPGAGALVLSDYAKGTLDPATLIAAARAAGVAALVDPKSADPQRYRGATLLTPNLDEFRALCGSVGLAADGVPRGGDGTADEAALARRGAALIERLELQALLVTRSERGVTLLRRDAPPLHLPARAREVYDVTGAGDTVVATLAAALAAGSGLADATALANAAAGIAVGRLGTAAVDAETLAAQFDQTADGDGADGVVDEPTLLARARAARAAGRRIVMTNGCFDILHSGHVQYLQRARRLGDRLIVAVNDDASVTRLKGPGRPLNPLADRLRVLAALAAVDWVVPFAEDTPARLIAAVMPHVLVKGGDYRAEDVAGGDVVRAGGGEVAILDFVAGRSTSALLARIRER